MDFAQRKITASRLHDHGLSWGAALGRQNAFVDIHIGTSPVKARCSIGPMAASETQITNDQVSLYI